LKFGLHKKSAKLTFMELHTPEYGLRGLGTPAREARLRKSRTYLGLF
jgi:hypothetical protein